MNCATLPGRYGEPGGLLMIAWDGEKPAGTIALRRLSEESCEAKRLFVSPEFRGQGLGLALLNRIIAETRSMGYRTMYGDSLPSMIDAGTLYREYGFRQVGLYSAAPTRERFTSSFFSFRPIKVETASARALKPRWTTVPQCSRQQAKARPTFARRL